MLSVIKTLLSLLLIAACIISADNGVYAAGSSSQTVLNPAAPRKSLYPRIVIYTVAWCPHCRELKEYLTTRNIPFINRDVELETAAMDDLMQKYKTYSVPVVVIGNDQEILKGFTSEQFEKAVVKVNAAGR
ncbi:MAG: glutaredoxin domain-containing protein [Desulfuromonadaceae bacterium]|nr:glutaredoxin domain-containing protein [Desulfuromonadaceae bacterium]